MSTPAELEYKRKYKAGQITPHRPMSPTQDRNAHITPSAETEAYRRAAIEGMKAAREEWIAQAVERMKRERKQSK